MSSHAPLQHLLITQRHIYTHTQPKYCACLQMHSSILWKNPHTIQILQMTHFVSSSAFCWPKLLSRLSFWELHSLLLLSLNTLCTLSVSLSPSVSLTLLYLLFFFPSFVSLTARALFPRLHLTSWWLLWHNPRSLASTRRWTHRLNQTHSRGQVQQGEERGEEGPQAPIWPCVFVSNTDALQTFFFPLLSTQRYGVSWFVGLRPVSTFVVSQAPQYQEMLLFPALCLFLWSLGVASESSH